MKITVIGTGYVGLVSGVCFASLGHEVICVDKDEGKIAMLRRGEVPIYEPGLKELIDKNTAEERLFFTTDISAPVRDAEIIIIAVGTPQSRTGEANLSYIEQAAMEIARSMNGYKIIVTKSTVPVGTNERIKGIVSGRTTQPFDIVSVPEFLREGSAVKDTLYPDRIVIGTESDHAGDVIVQLHQPLTDHIIVTDIRSAEMIKYASNAFLATKISFINEIANICEKVGADVTEVARGMGYDKRIGSSFLQAGIGYGGSCFPKDTQALVQIAGHVEYDFKLLRSVIEVNQLQRLNIIKKLRESLGTVQSRTIGIWGLSFKPNTDDVREAPSLEIIPLLIDLGATVKVYDPIAMDNFNQHYASDSVIYCRTAEEAAKDSDALCLLTEWEEFGKVDLTHIERLMKQPILVDGRNVFSSHEVAKTGFYYYSIGRPLMNSLHLHHHEYMDTGEKIV